MKRLAASVIVCVYNRGEQVQKCLASLLAMGRADFEIVLVDDASTDDTPERLRAFRDAHPDRPVTLVRNDRNRGVSGARNAGIDAARGDVVCFTDSDCTVDPGWLSALLTGFSGPEVAAVSGLTLNVPPRTYAESAYAGSNRIGQTRGQGRSLQGANMAVRLDLAARYRFDEALTYYCDEDDLAWRLQTDGYRINFVPGAVVHHDHPLRMPDLWRQSLRQGQGAARYWYKRGIYVGRDIFCLIAALLTLPLALLDPRLLAVPSFFLCLQIIAVAYNEVFFKGKTTGAMVKVLPLCLLFQVGRLIGFVPTLLRIPFGGEQPIRDSKRRWMELRKVR